MPREPRHPDSETPREQLEREVRQEVGEHLDRLESMLAEQGLSREEARAEARRRFGDPDRAAREAGRVRLRRLRSARRRELWGGLLHDLRSAWRALAMRPGFALTALVMLAVGSGAAVTTYSVMEGVLLSPLPFRDPEQLYRITLVPVSLAEGRTRSADQLLDWHPLVDDAFAELALYHPLPHGVNLDAGGEPLRAEATEVSADFFTVLGAAMVRGRAFAPADADSATPTVAMISEGLWRGRLGADPAIVGSVIAINGNPHRVTGIVASEAALPEGIDVWLPVSFELSHMVVRGGRFFQTLARTHPGVSPEQAGAAIARFDHWLEAEYPGTSYADLEPAIEPLQDALVNRVRTPIWLLFAATGLVLAITTANVAGYLLARAHARQAEYAVRAALGAGARRLLTQSLGEAAILATGGALAGLALAVWCTGLLRGSVALAIPRADQLSLDAGALAFTIMLTTLTTLGAGLAPAVATIRPGRGAPRGHGPGRTVGSGGSGRTRDVLLVVQVTLALVLAVAAAVLGQSWAALVGVDTGFADETMTFSVILDDVAYPSPESRQRFTAAVLERLRDTEKVAAAGASVTVPLAGDAVFGVLLSLEGAAGDGEPRVATYLPVTPGYIEAMGIHVLTGRALARQDDDPATPGTVVNATFRDRYLADRSALGTRVQVGERVFTIIGVAENVRRFDLRQEPEPAFYLPAGVLGSAPRYFVVRAPELGIAGMTTVVRDAVRSVDPSLPVAELRTLGDLRHRELAGSGLLAAVFAGFAGLGLVLAAFGLYAVLTQWTVARTAETGVRMALGATGGRILLEFVRRGTARCGLGLLVGAAVYGFGARWLESQLFGVRAFDPATLFGVTLALTAVWLVAMLLPARRAARLDPARALRRH